MPGEELCQSTDGCLGKMLPCRLSPQTRSVHFRNPTNRRRLMEGGHEDAALVSLFQEEEAEAGMPREKRSFS